MTIAEQLEEQHKSGKMSGVWRAIQLIIAVSVMVMALVLVNVNRKAETTANQANTTAKQIESLLKLGARYTCRARATTLRTAPQTVREIRNLQDAESVQARVVCPDLDYKGLALDRAKEAALLDSGADPEWVALQRGD